MTDRQDPGNAGNRARKCRALPEPDAWLASGGLRPTRQRLALAELLVGDGRHRHVTAESLFAAARATGADVSRATVYNALGAFREAGLVQEVAVEGARSHFDTDTRPHPHYYWEKEGRIADAPVGDALIERIPPPPEGAEIASVDVVIRLRPAAGPGA